MPVGYRSSSTTGNATFASSRAPAVPSGATTDDIVVVFLQRYQNSGAVTPPAGFTSKSTHDGSTAQIEIFWKRLTGSDGGTYSFSWSGSQWSNATAICITGAVATGDPLGTANAWSGTAGSFGSTSVTTVDEPALLWNAYNDTAAAGGHTPPTSFTEVTDDDSTSMAYRIPATTGSHTASGGSVSSSSAAQAVLVAVSPVAGPPPNIEGSQNSNAMQMMGRY